MLNELCQRVLWHDFSSVSLFELS